jgi:hypothetical protein
MNDPKDCAHQACRCRVAEDGEYGKYCSAHCEEAGDLTELHCECGHLSCEEEPATET